METHENYLKTFFLTVALVFTIANPVEGHEKKWPGKRLERAWPTVQNFSSKQISLTPAQISQLNTDDVKIGSEDRSPTFYFAQEKDSSSDKPKTIGIILFVDEYGANGKIEISVAMGPDGKTKKVDIWEHTESSLIAKDAFLKQFAGKTSKDTFIINKDYQPIVDATKASEAVARAVEKALKVTNIIFEKK